MRKIYKYFINVSLLFIYILFFWNSYSYSLSDMPRETYNPVNVGISEAMRYIAFIIEIFCCIIAIICFIKVKVKNENLNIKKLIIWLIISILIVVELLLGSYYVYKAGKEYLTPDEYEKRVINDQIEYEKQLYK